MCHIVLKVEKREGRGSASSSFWAQQEPPHTELTAGKSQSFPETQNVSRLCARQQLLEAKTQQELLPNMDEMEPASHALVGSLPQRCPLCHTARLSKGKSPTEFLKASRAQLFAYKFGGMPLVNNRSSRMGSVHVRKSSEMMTITKETLLWLLGLSYQGQYISEEMLTLICFSQTTEKPTAAERRRGSSHDIPLPPLPSGAQK